MIVEKRNIRCDKLVSQFEYGRTRLICLLEAMRQVRDTRGLYENEEAVAVNNPSDNPRRSMYEVVFPVPDVTGTEDRLTLVIALGGYADAGHAVTDSAKYLLDALENRPLVTFSTDELVDYRSRRPAVTLNHDEIVDVSELSLSIDVVRDNVGKPFLLLSGPEPDMRWEAFSRAVADLAEQYDIGRAVSLYSAPMTVPHTRPLGVIGHGDEVSSDSNIHGWGHRVTVPGSASLNIEFELQKRGRSPIGLTAQVPHYVAQSEYPLASLRLLQEVSRIAGLDLPLKALERESARVAELLTNQTNESSEISQLVNLLEEQYDEETKRRELLKSSPLLGPDGTMPSADEIGAEFEKFLAAQPPRKDAQDHQDDGSSVEPTSSNADDFLQQESETEPPVGEPGAAGEDSRIAEPEPYETEGPEASPKTDGEQNPRRKRGWKPWFRF